MIFWFIGHVFSANVVPGKRIVSVICTVRDVKPNNLILLYTPPLDNVNPPQPPPPPSSTLLLHRLNRALVQLPIIPAPRIVTNVRPPRMLRQRRRALGPHARLAVEDERRVLARAREAVQVLEVLVRDVEALDGGGDGDVDGAGDLAGLVELVRFADVWTEQRESVSD